eukprot:9476908-Pyramimonas_sp.AAC.1
MLKASAAVEDDDAAAQSDGSAAAIGGTAPQPSPPDGVIRGGEECPGLLITPKMGRWASYLLRSLGQRTSTRWTLSSTR